MSISRSLRVVPLLVLAVAACSDDGEGAEPAPADPLEGRELIVTSVTDDGVEDPRVDERELRITFEDGRIGATGGCNILSGPYRFEGDVLEVDGMGGTEMACGQESMDLDDWLVDVLSARHTVSFDGAEVVLTSGPTTVGLIDRQAVRPDAPLVGTSWVLDATIEGNGASSLPRDFDATVTFADDGTFAIDTGCNTGSGSYEQTSDTTVVLDGATITAIGCGEDVAEVEAAMLEVFAAGAADVIIHDRQLTLIAGDVGLGFQAAP